MLSTGAIRSDRIETDARYRFHSCNRDDIIRQMPNLVIRFDSISPIGEDHDDLILFPDDYIQFSAYRSDLCSFRFTINSLVSGTFDWFNPLLIPGVNVRLTPDSFVMCDRHENMIVTRTMIFL